MVDHLENRKDLLRQLREELVGPSPRGTEIDCTGVVNFSNPEDAYGPFRQAGNGEEILIRDSPTKRYGVGVLYPIGAGLDDDDTILDSSMPEIEPEGPAEAEIDDGFREKLEEISARASRKGPPSERDTNDLDLSITNAFKPSSMGISFLCRVPEGTGLVVLATGGRYRKKTVVTEGRERIWWLREPVEIEAEFSSGSLNAGSFSRVLPDRKQAKDDHLKLGIELFCRPTPIPDEYLLTVCLVNRETASNSTVESCLFQSNFTVEIVPEGGGGEFLPYPGPKRVKAPEAEEESLALLYRNTQTYAVGHGCAADWLQEVESGRINIRQLSAENLPSFETPSMTPDIKREDKTPIEVSMAELAGLDVNNDGFDSLREVVMLYEAWIEKRRGEAETLDEIYKDAATRHLDDCVTAWTRMKDGLDFLQNDPNALRAFSLANKAILIQQARSQLKPRELSYNTKTIRLELSGEYPKVDLMNIQGRGKWRAFQIAFLLMSLRSAADPRSDERETVELIWFPTGGGKTEAYLGLSAFSLFMRRLSDPSDEGVDVLMRYTLRLLTAQQFQRASGLICAMEHIRRELPEDLGEAPFSIGIWLGDATTPNTRKGALDNLKDLKKGDKYAENKFILTRCPWCSAQIGPIKYKGNVPRGAPRVAGYEHVGETVVFRCTDEKCEFKGNLPIYVIDEDIYETRPSLVIGTVDKFATLAWKPQARSLFGVGPDGEREVSPPGLIIQDELHLISGPLGSMYGLYEVAIEELCTDYRDSGVVRPKVVSSTATIRRYQEQIKALYGRTKVSLFPPPGLDDGDSFFAKYARDDNGKLREGRMYVGVHAPGLGSMQTVQVRALSALLQAPMPLSPEERDPWWTLVLFFNSLRELGTTLTLFQSDIPDYFGVLKNRNGAKPDELRSYKYLNVRELTGRLRSDEVPEAIKALEVNAEEPYPVDVCLASNIIEVGIDIERLSLMCIVGQPKTTSQYIQVSGRVGRKWWERPGMVVTLYGAAKARDRSHFEKFRSYHEKLYAQVEPTSVTPFSPPVLDRALHAVLVAFSRQAGDESVANSPYPFPETLIDRFCKVLEEKVRIVDEHEASNLTSLLNKRINQWKKWERTIWESRSQVEDVPLLRRAGEYVPTTQAKISWSTPNSLRNVDAECQAEITKLYLMEEGEDA